MSGTFDLKKILMVIASFFFLATSVQSQLVYTEDFGTSTTVLLPYTFGTNATGSASKDINFSNPSWNQTLPSQSFTGNTGGCMSSTVSTNVTLTSTFTLLAGYELNTSSITYDYRSTTTGPTTLNVSITGTSGTSGSTATATLTRNNTFITNSLNAITASNLTGIITITITASGSGGGNLRFDNFTLNGTVISTTPVTPTKLAITSISPTTPAPGAGFSATVQAQDATNAAGNVSANTSFTLSTNGNAGTIGGTVTGTILAGTNSIVVSGITLSTAGTGATITATRTAGDALTAGTSAAFNVAVSSSATDYFRSNVTNGSWATPASWQSSPSSGGPWNTATLAPTSSATDISILNGHQISITTSGVSMKATSVKNGGILEVASINSYTIAGAGNQLIIENGGILLVNAAGTIAAPSIAGNILVKSGGKITLGPLITAATFTADNYLNTSSKVIYEDAAIFEYNTTANTTLPSAGSQNYFTTLSVSDLPIFRVSAASAVSFGAGANNVFNCVFEVNANWGFVNAGTKTIRGGVRGTATVNQTGGAIIFPNSTSVLDGSVTINIVNNGLQLTNGAIVPLNANVRITSTPEDQIINKLSGSLLINGTLDVTDLTIRNTVGTAPDITVNGTLKTSNKDGLIGATGTTILNTSGSLVLNTGCTIDYNATVNQAISSTPSYYNITFSGSATKTPNSAISLNTLGTVKITGAANVDATGNNIGSTGANTTALVMDGTGVFILGTTGTLPLMDGTYTLTSGIVRFAGTSQTIRTKSYQNIEVTGTGVGNSSGNITLNANGTFKVKNTGVGTGGIFSINDNSITCPSGGGVVTVENSATFRTGNNEGFSGFTATFTNNSSVHSNILASNIILASGSTVDYAGTSAQKISNQIPYQNFAISATAAVNKTAPGNAGGDLVILGNITKGTGATFLHNNGTVSLEGTAPQTYTATDAGMEFYTLVNKNTTGTGFNVNNNLGVVNQFILSPVGRTASSIVTFGAGNINLRSSLAQTASIPDLGTALLPVINYTGAGRFQIERYLFEQKSWRLLSTPVLKLASDATTPTINDSWREGGTILAATGYGTRVTGPGTLGAPLGVDENTQRGSMKSYSMANNNYLEVTAADLAAGKTIANDEGYYIFVRGDRGIDVPSGTSGITTLRMKGQIRTGDQTFSVNANAFQSVGNPFTSRLQFANITKTGGTEDAFTVWNPTNLGGGYGVGRFEQYANISGNYSGSFGIRNFIESGEAFFISASTSSGTLIIKEGDKVAGSANVSRVGVTIPTLEINLFATANDNTEYKADVTLLNFDPLFNNSINNEDVKKFSNASDNVSILNGTTKLFVERRNTLTINDTIYLSLTNTRVASYKFEIDPSVLSNLPLNAFLLDKFLLTETPVSLTAVTMVPFSITSDAASRVADRFKIVFKQNNSGPLPVTFTGIAASVNTDKTNTVKWFVSNEVNLASYVIEKSTNGVRFDAIGNSAVAGNTAYSFIDASPLAAVNYYRVKAISNNGQVQYSAIVKLSSADVKPGFSIQPNPVVNKTMHINFKNMEGVYSLTLTSKHGATVFSKQITLAAGSPVKDIALGDAVAAGVYDVVLVDAKGKQMVQSIFVQ